MIQWWRACLTLMKVSSLGFIPSSVVRGKEREGGDWSTETKTQWETRETPWTVVVSKHTVGVYEPLWLLLSDYPLEMLSGERL